MIISVTLSKPTSEVLKKLGKEYQKIKIKASNSADGASYQAEMFTKLRFFIGSFLKVNLKIF